MSTFLAIPCRWLNLCISMCGACSVLLYIVRAMPFHYETHASWYQAPNLQSPESHAVAFPSLLIYYTPALTGLALLVVHRWNNNDCNYSASLAWNDCWEIVVLRTPVIQRWHSSAVAQLTLLRFHANNECHDTRSDIAQRLKSAM